jgi:hypothetical protein
MNIKFLKSNLELYKGVIYDFFYGFQIGTHFPDFVTIT